MKVLSWGSGVQSTTLGEMSAQGILDPLDAVITADTGWERQATYDARGWYTERWQAMGLQVHVVSAGDIRQLGVAEHVHIPFWTATGGPLRRQCTRHIKIRPIRRLIRQLLGYDPSNPPAPPAGSVELWLGISLDEWTRAKPNDIQYIIKRYPLLELKMTRQHCIDWLQSQHLPIPPKSACVCCPYRRASEWIAMRDEAPDEFAAAVAFDQENRSPEQLQRAGVTEDRLYIYKHAEPEPLATADLEADAARERRRYGTQIPFFFCESGHCWT